jgi:hypothetical protein
MDTTKQRVKLACDERNIPISTMLMNANIQSGDFYSAVNGKRPFFPGWRRRIADVLGMSETELFPEFTERKEV